VERDNRKKEEKRKKKRKNSKKVKDENIHFWPLFLAQTTWKVKPFFENDVTISALI